MASPFCGMNPYLEHPDLWSEFHNRLIVALADDLAPSLRPTYRVAIEKRVYEAWNSETLLVGIPDVSVYHPAAIAPSRQAISTLSSTLSPVTQPMSVLLPEVEQVKETYLEVRDVNTGEVVTVIELLSPKNKRNGEGRQIYETKRRRILSSRSHFVEIDLLIQGDAMPFLGSEMVGRYRILVSRSDKRPYADLYPFELSDPIPTFALPLRIGETEPIVDLQILLHGVYERAGFDLAIVYDRDPTMRLANTEQNWIRESLLEKGLRNDPELAS
jgi:hypothetical protein